MNLKKLLVITLTFVVFAAANSALAQNSTLANKDSVKATAQNDAAQANPDDFVDLFRKDIRSQKKQIIAENMGLSDAEAQKF